MKRRARLWSSCRADADSQFNQIASEKRLNSPLRAIGRLRAAIARLREKYRIVLLLRDLEDLCVSEVSRRLGLTIPAR
jgi:DNA-directed RNA polymerase specialized sigma24 family protein